MKRDIYIYLVSYNQYSYCLIRMDLGNNCTMPTNQIIILIKTKKDIPRIDYIYYVLLSKPLTGKIDNRSGMGVILHD